MIPASNFIGGLVIVVGMVVSIIATLWYFDNPMLTRREKKVVPFDVGNRLIVEKKATLVGLAPNGQLVIKTPIEKPPKQEKPKKEKMTDAQPPKEVKLKSRIKIRFTKMKKMPNGTLKRVTLSTSTIPRKAVLIVRKTGLKQLPYAMHYADHTMLDGYDEMSFDENYAEPINPDTGVPEYSQELEGLLAHGIHGQMIEVATQFWKFVLERKHLIFMGLGLAAGFFVVTGLATFLHIFGGVQINWQSHLPG